MKYLLDTNLLLRFSDRSSPQHPIAVRALDRLDQEGHDLRTVPQIFYEYWVVASRSVAENGLGFSFELLKSQLREFSVLFPVMRDVGPSTNTGSGL